MLVGLVGQVERAAPDRGRSRPGPGQVEPEFPAPHRRDDAAPRPVDRSARSSRNCGPRPPEPCGPARTERSTGACPGRCPGEGPGRRSPRRSPPHPPCRTIGHPLDPRPIRTALPCIGRTASKYDASGNLHVARSKIPTGPQHHPGSRTVRFFEDRHRTGPVASKCLRGGRGVAVPRELRMTDPMRSLRECRGTRRFRFTNCSPKSIDPRVAGTILSRDPLSSGTRSMMDYDR